MDAEGRVTQEQLPRHEAQQNQIEFGNKVKARAPKSLGFANSAPTYDIGKFM